MKGCIGFTDSRKPVLYIIPKSGFTLGCVHIRRWITTILFTVSLPLRSILFIIHIEDRSLIPRHMSITRGGGGHPSNS